MAAKAKRLVVLSANRPSPRLVAKILRPLVAKNLTQALARSNGLETEGVRVLRGLTRLLEHSIRYRRQPREK